MHWYGTQLLIAERQHELERSETTRRYRDLLTGRRAGRSRRPARP